MEHITMVVAITYGEELTSSKPNKLVIGQKEVAVQGRTIVQWLEAMERQGWRVIGSRAMPDRAGIICEYDFEREPPGTASRARSPQTRDEQNRTR